jgi:DUF2892 family protein
MKCNLSPLDAGIRAGLGMAMVASPLLDLPTYPANWLGLALIATGVASFCPLYALVRALVFTHARPTGRQATTAG